MASTLVTHVCACCTPPTDLLPRDDLPGGIAVCQATGQLYRPEGMRYVPATLPTLPSHERAAPGVRIDLSRSGYA